MKLSGISFIVVALCLVLLVDKCNGETVRYRLTLEVDDNGVMRTGSSVMEVRFLPDGLLGAVPPGIRGNALIIDMEEKGVLAVLLHDDLVNDKSTGPAGLVIISCLTPSWTLDDVDNIRMDGRKIPIPFDRLPLTVIIPDPTNPDTMRRIGPQRLATSFGDGVALLSATLEITDDPLSTGIEKRLRWLERDNENYIGESKHVTWPPARLIDRLTVSSFKK